MSMHIPTSSIKPMPRLIWEGLILSAMCRFMGALEPSFMGLHVQAGTDKVYGAVSTCVHLEPHEWWLAPSPAQILTSRRISPHMREALVGPSSPLLAELECHRVLPNSNHWTNLLGRYRPWLCHGCWTISSPNLDEYILLSMADRLSWCSWTPRRSLKYSSSHPHRIYAVQLEKAY